MAVSLNNGQCIISGPLSSHFKVTVNPSQRTNYNFNSTQATRTDNYMYIYRKAISMMHVTPYQHSDSVFCDLYSSWNLVWNDYEYKMDSSLDTTDSDFLTNDDDYGQNLLNQIKQMNKKFRLACKQVVLMNNEIEYLQNRYDRAVQQSNRSYRYFLRLKIATIEGISNMFYDYASQHADKFEKFNSNLNFY